MPRILSSHIDRRTFLLGAAVLACAGRAGAAVPPHSFRHGAFEISVISDGHLVLPANVLGPDVPRPELDAVLEAAGLPLDMVRPATNVTLIRTSSDLILVDTGSGPNFQPTAGKLAENLAAAGIDRRKITKVVFTHAHPDHLWGTTDEDAKLRFPNASYVVSEAEWNFWNDPDLRGRMPEDLRPFAAGAQREFARIEGKVATVKPGEDIVTGVRVLDTAGHTPGHISLELAGGDGLIVVGDAVPTTHVNFAHPEWRFAYDMGPDMAIASRKKLLDRAAAEKTKLIGFHFAYPGVGFAERKDGAYRFVAG